MAYNKHTWTTQELITADKLNNMESGIDDSIKTQPDIKSGTHSLNSINNNKVANLSNLYGYMGIQEIIIDPRTGYRYVFGYIKNSDNSVDLTIIEYDELIRYRSNMKVTHGVNKTSWLHGQYVQFDYYNTDDNKVVFLVGGAGESVRVEYKPYTTAKYDDLPVFFTLEEKSSWSQLVDFDNNKAISVVLNEDSANKEYTFNFYMYDLDPQTGNVTKVGSYSDTIDIPNGYVSQGGSAAPASSYLNRDSNGTMLFMTAGTTNTDGSYTEMSIRTYLIEDDKLIPYSIINQLEKSGGYSTSNTSPRNSYIAVIKDTDNVLNIKYREVEGSTQVKIGDKWIFVTNIIAAKDSNWFNNSSDYRKVNSEIYQLAFGDNDLIDALRNIGEPKYNNYIGVESLTNNLYEVYMPGSYQVSPTKLASLPDAPFVLRQGKDTETIGGTGIDSVQLDVSYQGSNGRFKQTLTIQSYSYMKEVDFKFERSVRTNFTIGKPNTYEVGIWDFIPLRVIGNWNVLPMIKTTSKFLLPGAKRFLSSGDLASFFAEDNFVPANSGILEVLPIVIPAESNGLQTRIIQRFTEQNANIRVYERVVYVNTENVGTIFPMGIGGGYPSYSTLGTWKELTN